MENKDRFSYEMSVVSTLHGAATFTPHSTEDNWLIMSKISIYLYAPKRLQIIICKTDELLTFWASPGRFYLVTVFTVMSHNQGSILSMDLFLSMTHQWIHRIHLDPPGLEPLFCILLPWERECPPCYEPIYYRKKPSLRLVKEVLQRQHGGEWRDRRRNETYR